MRENDQCIIRQNAQWEDEREKCNSLYYFKIFPKSIYFQNKLFIYLKKKDQAGNGLYHSCLHAKKLFQHGL